MTDYRPEYDTLHEFRTLYLKAIARVWREGEYEFRDKMFNQGLNGLDVLSELAYDGQRIPWDVDLRFDPRGDSWVPDQAYGTQGWTLGRRGELKVIFPEDPTISMGSISDEEKADIRATALAAYYRQGGVVRPVDLIDTADGPPESLAVMHTFREFDGVCARALALAWEEKEEDGERKFRDALLSNEDAAQVLENFLVYSVPWNMKISFSFTNEADFTGEVWKDLPQAKIVLYVPKRPEKPEQRAIALASYNQTSDRYPLTCP